MKNSRRILVFFAVISSSLLIVGLVAQMYGETTAFTSSITSLIANNNFHEILPKRLYRSGEMSSKNLSNLISEKSIKTVLDLRLDPNEKDDGVITEKWITEANDASYVSVKLSSSKIPTIDQINELFKIFDTSELPLLIHCSSGTHRTGFAVFAWMMDKENVAVTQATEQLSLRYGFVRAERKLKSWWQSEPTLDSLVWQYVDEVNSKTRHTATAQEYPHGFKNKAFRVWILERIKRK